MIIPDEKAHNEGRELLYMAAFCALAYMQEEREHLPEMRPERTSMTVVGIIGILEAAIALNQDLNPKENTQ